MHVATNSEELPQLYCSTFQVECYLHVCPSLHCSSKMWCHTALSVSLVDPSHIFFICTDTVVNHGYEVGYIGENIFSGKHYDWLAVYMYCTTIT